MRKSLLITLALATAATVVAPTLATARYYRHGYHYYSGYSIAPYGHGRPYYQSPYGRYPAYTYDPDPQLRAMLRSDFNRGVNAPGGR
jgi:hypothetical protein